MPRLIKISLAILGFLLLVPIVFRPAVQIYIAAQMRRFSRHSAQTLRNVALPNRGIVQIRGSQVMENMGDLRTTFLWRAEYRAGEQAAVEFAGSWRADKDEMKAYAARGLVFVVPLGDYYMNGISKILIRTAQGKWKEIQLDFRDINDGIDPPDLTSYLTSISVEDLRKIRTELGPGEHEMGPSSYVTDFHPDSGELKVVYSTRTGGGRVQLRFSEDGESLHLDRIENLSGKRSR